MGYGLWNCNKIFIVDKGYVQAEWKYSIEVGQASVLWLMGNDYGNEGNGDVAGLLSKRKQIHSVLSGLSSKRILVKKKV